MVKYDLNEKYIVLGINKIAKDFIYVFDEILNIESVTDLFLHTNNSILNHETLNIDDAVTRVMQGSSKFIVCTNEVEKYTDFLRQIEMHENKHYYFSDYFLMILDDFHFPVNKKIAVWGTGHMANVLRNNAYNLNIDVYIDTFSTATEHDGIPVVKPQSVVNWRDYYVIVAIINDSEVLAYLSNCGLKYEDDYIEAQKIISLPSNMLYKTMYDSNTYDLDCRTMLNHLEILRDGDTMCCCSTFIDHKLGNVLENRQDEIWNSKIHKIMCLSVENRTYSFCKKNMCPLFIDNRNDASCDLFRPYRKMKEHPEVLALGYDKTCNLACETCRNDFYIAKGDYKEQIHKITETVKREYLDHADFLILAGDGEVFLSNEYRDVFTDENCQPKYLRLLSNGLLFNEKNWKRITEGKNTKMMLTVSVDAATKKTYEKIRKGGNFDILKTNMEYASKLRKEGQLSYFRLNFVVQEDNCREMPLFVEWGKELDVDEVFFTKILNWGTYSKEEFKKVSIMEEDGITPKPLLKEILEDERLSDPIVDLGTIQYKHNPSTDSDIENYYMWELERKVGGLFKE